LIDAPQGCDESINEDSGRPDGYFIAVLCSYGCALIDYGGNHIQGLVGGKIASKREGGMHV